QSPGGHAARRRPRNEPARAARDARRAQHRSHREGIPAAGIPHAAHRADRHAHDAARVGVEPAFRSADEFDRRPHEPAAPGDRSRFQRAVVAHDPWLRLLPEGSSRLRMRRMFASTARLALLYMFGVAVGVSALLGSAYLFTQRAMDKQVDLVIDTEIESLREDYRGGGLRRLVSVLDQRDDDWGRLGAVYLLTDHHGTPLGGNLTAW